MAETELKPCPYCKNLKGVYRNGWQILANGMTTQRFYCSKCDKAFK
jgi:transposase-like protein